MFTESECNEKEKETNVSVEKPWYGQKRYDIVDHVLNMQKKKVIIFFLKKMLII